MKDTQGFRRGCSAGLEYIIIRLFGKNKSGFLRWTFLELVQLSGLSMSYI